MTGSDRIWATEDKGNFGEDKFFTTRPIKGLTEYIRRDPAVLAAIPEAQALIAAAYEAAASVLDDECDLARIALPQAVPVLRADARDIRALTPADATAALAARDAAMQAKGMREAAGIAWALEDGDRWTRAAAQNAILARADQIERDAK